MSERPIGELLRDDLDEAAVPRLWRGVQARRGQLRAKPWSRALVVSSSTVGALAIAAALWLALRPDAPAAPAALRQASGAPVRAIGERVRYDDGSWTRTARGTSVHVLANSGNAFVLHLREGRIECEVHPNGPRVWRIEAGDASVEVVGTHFWVERSGAHVRVRVQRGTVIVRHPELDDGVQRLDAGDAVEVGRPVVIARAEPEPEPAIEAPVVEPPMPLPPRSPEPWRVHARRGQFDEAYEALGPEGVEEQTASAGPSELMDLADVALLSGHPAEAEAPLSQLLARHPHDPRAGLAAFTLGRIELDHLARPADAAGHFERAIELGLSSSLADDARARLATARQRSGDREGAQRAACDYLEHAPDGPRAASLRALCEAR